MNWHDFLSQSLSLLQQRLAAGKTVTTDDRILIERIADVAVLVDEFQAADDFLSALAANCSQEGLLFAADYARLKRVHVAVLKQDLARTHDLLEELEPSIGAVADVPYRLSELAAWENACRWMSRKESRFDANLLFSRLYLSMGRCLACEGQYGHAVVLLERGATHARIPASDIARRAWVPLRLSSAAVLLEQGQLDECTEVLNELVDLVDPLENPGWHVERLELAGRLCLLRGDYGAALDNLAEVSESCRNGRFAGAALGALMNQADVLIVLNQITVAEELLEEAAALARALNDHEALVRISWLEHLAEVRSRSLIESVAIAPTATEMQRGTKPTLRVIGHKDEVSPLSLPAPTNFFALFEQRALGVQWALSRGDVALADELLAEARKTFADCQSPLIQSRLFALAGMVAYDGADFDAAARIFAELQPQFQERGLKSDLWQTLRFRVWSAARLNASEEEIQQLSAQMRQLLDELASSLPAAQRAVYLLNKWTAEENILRVEIDELGALKADVAAAPWFKRPWLKWKLWGKLARFLFRVDENRRILARKELSAPAKGGDARNLTPRWLFCRSLRSATISFLVLPDRVFTATSTWMKLDFAVTPLTRLRVRQLVSAWHRTAATGYGASENELAKIGDDLVKIADVLDRELDFSEVIELLPQRVKRIAIVADDSLHGFPFAAFRHKDKYLIETFALSMAFDRAGPMDRSAEALNGGEKALAVAVALGAKQIGADPLPGTVPEIRQTEDWLKSRGLQVCTLIDEDASREAVLRAWARAPFVHVACHGVFEPDRPDASGLVMIPQPGRVEVISLRDLAQLDLPNLRHVTLSSCWGADSFVLPGRWIVSLPETLCRCGADSVLSCLWPIDDEVGKAFAFRFNQYLGKVPRDEALSATQQDCINNTLLEGSNRNTEDPLFWAGYRLHGKTSRIVF